MIIEHGYWPCKNLNGQCPCMHTHTVVSILIQTTVSFMVIVLGSTGSMMPYVRKNFLLDVLKF